MPFTLAHPAIVVPLARRRLILSALVIGSMTPDFEYFIRLSDVSHISHSVLGIFLFCIPMGLFVLFLFHKLLKYPVIALMPASLQERLLPIAGKFHFGRLKQFMLIILSLFVGACSHLAWDSFTHEHGWFVRNFSILRHPVHITSEITIQACRVLQQGSTIIGLAVLIYFFIKWYKNVPRRTMITPNYPPEKNKMVMTVALISLSIVVSGLYGIFTVRHCPLESLNYFLKFLRAMVISGMSLLFVEFIIYSSIWHLIKASKYANKI